MVKGWYGNSQKHSMASRGIKSSNNDLNSLYNKKINKKHRIEKSYFYINNIQGYVGDIKREFSDNMTKEEELFIKKRFELIEENLDKIPKEIINAGMPNMYGLFERFTIHPTEERLYKLGFFRDTLEEVYNDTINEIKIEANDILIFGDEDKE